MIEAINLINEVGFPVMVCVAFAWYTNKRDNQRMEMEKEAKYNEVEERKKLVETIEMYRDTNQELLTTNKEVSETNRLLVNEINHRMNTVENTLIEMNQKL